MGEGICRVRCRIASWGLGMALACAVCSEAGAQVPLRRGVRPEMLADGRDHYTLLTQRFLNRQLPEQISADDQLFRLGRGWENAALAADASIGSQQTPQQQTRFHGFYILDTFSAVRPFPGADANLNLTLFNPSASDGYRVSSSVSAQLALHLYFDAEPVPGELVELDVVGTDLGPTTMGAGLLLEQWPLEGVLASAEYRDVYFRHIFGGRGFWPDDDILIFQLGWQGLVEVALLQWQLDRDTSPLYFDAALNLPIVGAPLRAGDTVAPDLELQPTFRVAAEYAGRLKDESWRHGALGRADFLTSVLVGLNLHLGYQFRWYQQGFAPRDDLTPPTSTYNLPFREDYYVTNSFEYFGVSNFFSQWSHTLMGEVRVPLGPYFSLAGELEYIWRSAKDQIDPARYVALEQGGSAPGTWSQAFYRAALQLNPWPGLPHRLSTNLTNKQVNSRYDLTAQPVTQLFEDGTWVLFLAEAFF